MTKKSQGNRKKEKRKKKKKEKKEKKEKKGKDDLIFQPISLQKQPFFAP